MLSLNASLHMPSFPRPARHALIALLAVLAFALPWSDVALGQSGPGVYEGVAGPYRVVVEVVPERPLAGKVQFRVRPTIASDAAAVQDAMIDVYLGRNGAEGLKTPALNSPADRTVYVGNADLTRAGDWHVRVEMRSPAGTGAFEFTLSVRERARSGGGLVAPTFVYLGATVLIAVGVGWLVIASRRARRAPGRTP
jgi:hypothetical protein